MNLRERVLGVLSCQYVDQIIIGAPYSVTEAILSVVPKVHIVVHGFTESVPDLDGKDSYAVLFHFQRVKRLNSTQFNSSPSRSVSLQPSTIPLANSRHHRSSNALSRTVVCMLPSVLKQLNGFNFKATRNGTHASCKRPLWRRSSRSRSINKRDTDSIVGSIFFFFWLFVHT